MGEDPEWEGDHDWYQDEEEKKHIFSVLDSFRQYRRAAHFNVTHIRRQNFYALPTAQWQILAEAPFNFLDTLNRVDEAIDVNSNLAEAILSNALGAFGLEDRSSQKQWRDTSTKLDVDKARSTLHQLYRDWSAEGAEERSACYEPILSDLAELFSMEDIEKGIDVLVPGAGLGRLVFDLSQSGYQVEGNEISFHQLLTSSFVLNHTTRAHEWTLHPFALSFANHATRQDQLRAITIPDVCPRASPSGTGTMKMTTGDFSVVYKKEEYMEKFDAIATCFFIDTAPNLIEYINTVRSCLKSGGVWTNVGPLLWHVMDDKKKEQSQTSDSGGNAGDSISTALSKKASEEDLGIAKPGSFELSQDEIVRLLAHHGFKFLKHEINDIGTGYVQNQRSMLLSVYRPVHWVVTKD